MMSSFFQSFDLKLRCFVEENYISLKDGDSENENFEDAINLKGSKLNLMNSHRSETSQ